MTNKELFVKYYYPGLHKFRKEFLKYTKNNDELSCEEFNEYIYDLVIKSNKINLEETNEKEEKEKISNN